MSLLKNLFLLFQIFKFMLFFRYSLEKLAVISLSAEETSDKIFTIFDVCVASDLVIGTFDFLIVLDEDLHFVF